MKAKTLVLSAIICGASILGLNFSTVYAATNFQTAQINQNIEIEQLSQKDRNGLTGAGKAIAAIEAAKNKDKHKNDKRHEDYHHRGHHHNPPPVPHHHHR